MKPREDESEGDIVIDEDIAEGWIGWRLVVGEFCTYGEMVEMSIDEAEIAGRVMDLRNKVRGR